jgi:hypothetical protein
MTNTTNLSRRRLLARIPAGYRSSAPWACYGRSGPS